MNTQEAKFVFECLVCHRLYNEGEELKNQCCVREYKEARERFGIVDLRLRIPQIKGN